MYYAYKDLRTEKAWALWEHTKDASSRRPPSIWPTFRGMDVQCHGDRQSDST